MATVGAEGLKTSNALVTLITAEKNCFQESFKVIKTVGISKFI